MRKVLVALLSVSALSYGQSVISAHSGVVQYVEGDATIDNQPVQPKFAQFPDVKPDQVLATEDGRVELLLTPGVFLRLAENSSVRMISNSLADTRLAVLSGSALVEVAELLPNNAITLEAAGTQIVLPKKGLYRIDAEPALVRVYDGQASVAGNAIHKGHAIALGDSAAVAANFDAKDTDSFYRWSARRTEYVAQANLESARVANNPLSSGYTEGVNTGAGRWAWNSGFGMFTYMPGSGVYNSPFGSTFYGTMIVPAYVSSLPRATSVMPVSGLGSGGSVRPASPLGGTSRMANRGR
jgi:hypothetical protein